MDSSFRSFVTASLAFICLLAVDGRAIAQDLNRGELATVRTVDLVVPRIDGPPALILTTPLGRIRLADGIYRNRDRTSLVVRNGQILEVRDAKTETTASSFRVSQIEKVAVRHADSPDGLYLKDARGRTMALPDGRFTSESGLTMVVYKATVTAYGEGR